MSSGCKDNLDGGNFDDGDLNDCGFGLGLWFGYYFGSLVVVECLYWWNVVFGLGIVGGIFCIVVVVVVVVVCRWIRCVEKNLDKEGEVSDVNFGDVVVGVV